MDSTGEAAIAAIAAFLGLVSALWDPGISAVIGITVLASLAIYKLAVPGKSHEQETNGDQT